MQSPIILLITLLASSQLFALPMCINHHGQVNSRFIKCVNSNFSELADKAGIELRACKSPRHRLTLPFQACVTQNFIRLATKKSAFTVACAQSSLSVFTPIQSAVTPIYQSCLNTNFKYLSKVSAQDIVKALVIGEEVSLFNPNRRKGSKLKFQADLVVPSSLDDGLYMIRDDNCQIWSQTDSETHSFDQNHEYEVTSVIEKQGHLIIKAYSLLHNPSRLELRCQGLKLSSRIQEVEDATGGLISFK